jgi:predicted nucleic acid-binding protein
MMKQVFVDTSYWIALANSRDQLHELALQISGRISPVHLVTTDEVLNSQIFIAVAARI